MLLSNGSLFFSSLCLPVSIQLELVFPFLFFFVTLQLQRGLLCVKNSRLLTSRKTEQKQFYNTGTNSSRLAWYVCMCVRPREIDREMMNERHQIDRERQRESCPMEVPIRATEYNYAIIIFCCTSLSFQARRSYFLSRLDFVSKAQSTYFRSAS